MEFSQFMNQKKQYLEILEKINFISEVIGDKWINRKLKEFNEKQNKNKNIQEKTPKIHKISKEIEIHPLILDFYHLKKWINEYQKNKLLTMQNIGDQVIKITYLCYLLKNTKHLKGFDKFLNRLKKISEYESALFELEVAFHYIFNKKNVEFIEETRKKTPDLKIQDKFRTVFAECKCKNKKSPKEEKTDNFFNQLTRAVLNECSKKKQNVMIIVNALTVPESNEIIGLKNFILESLLNGGIGVIDNTKNILKQELDETKKFKVATKIINDDDKIHNSNYFEAPQIIDKEYSFMMSAIGNSSSIFNPMIFAYKTEIDTINEKSYQRIFSSAVSQLPKGNAGIIWIRIPEHKWEKEIDKAKKIIEKEISGNHNQRVSMVNFMTTETTKTINEKEIRIKFNPKYETILHKNPNIELS